MHWTWPNKQKTDCPTHMHAFDANANDLCTRQKKRWSVRVSCTVNAKKNQKLKIRLSTESHTRTSHTHTQSITLFLWGTVKWQMKNETHMKINQTTTSAMAIRHCNFLILFYFSLNESRTRNTYLFYPTLNSIWSGRIRQERSCTER